MVSRIAQLTLDVDDVELQAAFWSAALGMTADVGDDGAAMLHPPGGVAHGQTIWLQPVSEAKRDKIRLHLDLRPDDGDVQAEVERLVGLGASRTDVGQTGTEGFTVLADPEGNEFCVLQPLTPAQATEVARIRAARVADGEPQH
jgi:catechol 2,3-dioxygenase-like lactoylglutathione lyase family enzyme